MLIKVSSVYDWNDRWLFIAEIYVMVFCNLLNFSNNICLVCKLIKCVIYL